ncbi:MAG: multidrug effflux MFS transporter [Deltaproteobacteria bacterium]|jgi:DHA1 family bicyclomycin/chloramphenicol resistance-like MFS transporter|nr:multidrug effflux MFS transporter [Deltaproteobacteria bacterium]
MDRPVSAFTSGGLKRVSLFTLLGFLSVFAPFSTDMYLPAFSQMAAEMSTEVKNVQLSLAVFFLGLALGQFIYGPLSDRWGRRRPLMIGLIVYILASFFMIETKEISTFNALRFIQALGGCAGMVVARAVIRDGCDLKSSAKVFTIVMAIQAVGPVAAPVIGAYIVNITHWSAIFKILSCLGLACLCGSFVVLAESLPEKYRLRQSPFEIIKGFASLASCREFIVPALAGGLGGGALFAFISGSSFILIELHGVNKTAYGWIFGLVSLGVSLAAQSNLWLLKKYSARKVYTSGLFCTLILSSLLLVLLSFTSVASLYFFLVLVFLALSPCPLIYANTTALAMAASKQNIGAASSLVGVIHFGAASLSSLAVSFFHDGSARPMALVMIGSALSALMVSWFNRHGQV